MESGSKNSVLNGVRGLLAWIVLGVGLLLSLLTWNVARTHGNQTATEQLDSIVADVRTSIESRINNYADVLSSVRALHQATADRFSGKVFNEYLASLNLAQRYPGGGKDAHTLLKHADIAMYRVKDHGGNVFQFYALQMNGPSAPV